MKISSSLFHFLLLSYLASSALVAGAPVQLIIDTDLGFDVDDVGAIAVANHLQDIGACNILGVIYNTAFYKGIGGVDVINHYYSRKGVQMGSYRDEWGSSDDAQNAQDSYTSTIEEDYPSEIQNYDQVNDEVTAYRATLLEADNSSVVIVSIGEPTALRNILIAEPDLFAQKVKEIHYMDGGYNFGCGDSDGSGWSPWLGSTEDCDGAAQYVVEHVPRSIKQVFSLNGEGVMTGSRFSEDDGGCGAGPVKEAYQIYTNYGSRPSWDLISVYMAVMGTDSLYSTEYPGTMSVDYYGHEEFDESNTENNMFQVWIDDDHLGDVTRMLDDIICASPCGGPQLQLPLKLQLQKAPASNDSSSTELNNAKGVAAGGSVAVGGVGHCVGYTLQSGRNCYGYRGEGTEWHGADDLEDPVDSSAGTMTLFACQQLCDSTQGCDGVAVTPATDSTDARQRGLVECFRKSNIEIDACDVYYPFDMYTKNR